MAKYSIVHSVRVCTEFTPEVFGRLTTLGPAFLLPVGRQGEYKASQICSCVCGEAAIVGVGSLRSGNTKSCGCLQKATVSLCRTTHGMRKTSEYNSWCLMRNRCEDHKNPQYADYGGRGIAYCARWKKFENFFADMGSKPSPQHTLDRFPDKDGNYEPSNCRWATWEEQNNNTRRNHLLSYDGKIMTVAQWAKETGIKYHTIQSRLQAGWDVCRVLTYPVKERKKNHGLFVSGSNL